MEQFDFSPSWAVSNLLDSCCGFSAFKLLFQGGCRIGGSSYALVVFFSLLFYCVFCSTVCFDIMDPSSIVDDWSRLSLTFEEEEILVVADTEAVDRSNLSLELYLLGKLLCYRPLGAEAVRKNFRAALKLDNGL